MALETAGGIASIVAIIIDVASICLRLHNQIQEILQAVDGLKADISRLEKLLALLSDAENDQRQPHPRNILDGARAIVEECKRLRNLFADEVDPWTRNRYIFGCNWKFVYLFFFQRRRMRYMSKCVQNCLSIIGVVASITACHDLIRQAAMIREMEGMISVNHTETVNSLKPLQEHMTESSTKFEDEIGTESAAKKDLYIRQQKQLTNKVRGGLADIAKNDCQSTS